MRIKFYPKKGGFSAKDIRNGTHWLYADIECPHCRKLQAVSMTNYLGGPCICCGKRTSGETANMERGVDNQCG